MKLHQDRSKLTASGSAGMQVNLVKRKFRKIRYKKRIPDSP